MTELDQILSAEQILELFYNLLIFLILFFDLQNYIKSLEWILNYNKL